MRGPKSLKPVAAKFLAVAATALPLAAGSGVQAGNFKVLHSFCAKSQCGDGSLPGAPLVMDVAGNFFGTTDTGGNGNGVVFELRQTEPGKFKFVKLYQFCRHFSCNDGENPMAALIVDINGNLYGTTSRGGAGRGGVVFRLSPSDTGKWTETVLYDFCQHSGCPDGSTSAAGLTYAGAASGALYDDSSPLYGTTAAGGANGEGTVFSLVPNGDQWMETVLYSFCAQGGSNCTDGQMPTGGLLVDQVGNIYGTTPSGGVNHHDGDGAGVAYQLSPVGNGQWTETILYQFCSEPQCSDGEFPAGSLIFNGTGGLVGVTSAGGIPCDRSPYGCGTIFKIIPNGANSLETVVYAFCAKRDCKDGAVPEGGVALDLNGDLFGTATSGGGNDIGQMGLGGGVAYELSGSTYDVLHRFCSQSDCVDGEIPAAGLALDSLGALYGTASKGGAFGGGVLFVVRR